MTNPAPRDAAPDDAQHLQAIEEALAGIDDLGELPVDNALARLDAVHRILAEALNPGPERREKPRSGTNR